MESVDHAHLGKDFIALLHQVAAVFVGLHFDQPKMGLRVEQAGIYRHPFRVVDLRALRHLGRGSGADGGNLAIFKNHDPILDGAMGDREQLAADDRHQLWGSDRSVIRTGLERVGLWAEPRFGRTLAACRSKHPAAAHRPKSVVSVDVHRPSPSSSSAPSNPLLCITPWN